MDGVGGSFDDFSSISLVQKQIYVESSVELSFQLGSHSQSLGDLIIREILAINPDSLLGGKRTKAFAHFFLCLFC